MTLIIALFIVLALLTVLVFYELSWKEKFKKRWVQITLSVIFSAVLSPAIFHIIVSWNKEAENQFREAVIKGLYSQKVEYAQLEQLLILKYKEVFDKGEKEAEQWAKDFLSLLPDKRAEEARLETRTQELVGTLELRWNPLYKYLLTSFDKRAAQLMKHSSTKLTVSKDAPIVISNQVHQSQETLRKIVFPNENQLLVKLHTAVVDNGKITWYPNVIFTEMIKKSPTTVFVVTFRDDYYDLIVGHPRHKGFLEEVSAHDDPLEDVKFLSLINKAINRAFESGFL